MAKITFFLAVWLYRFMVFLHTLLHPNMWGSLHETHEQIFKTNQWKVSWYTLASESPVLPPTVKKENHQTFLNCHREAWWSRPSASSASGKYTEETASFPLTICITYCHGDWKVPRGGKKKTWNSSYWNSDINCHVWWVGGPDASQIIKRSHGASEGKFQPQHKVSISQS